MMANSQPEHQPMISPAVDDSLRQLDFFTNSQEQDSETLERALDWLAQEREKSINEWAGFSYL